MLGNEAYDNTRMTLAKIKTIRRFIQQKGSSDPEGWSYREYLLFRDKYLPLDKCIFPESTKIKDNSPNSIRNIRINTPNPRGHSKRSTSTSSHKESRSTSHRPETPLDAQKTPVYKPNSPHLEGNEHRSYHSNRPITHWDGEYFNMSNPPQFWGASNLIWQRRQRMNPVKGSAHSRYNNESERSLLRRTGGPPDIQHSVHSGRSIKKKLVPRRTGGSQGSPGPPDDPSSHSSHSISSITSRSRQKAKPRSSLSKKIQWDGQCSSFRPYKLAVIGHLLQNGGNYLVEHAFHASYLKYSKIGEDYLESEDFRVTYPDVTIKQAKVDRMYLYGMLVSSNRKDGERKILLKYEHNQDDIAAWIEFLRDYDNNGSEEVRATKFESMVAIKYTYKYPGGFLKYIDTLQANLNELDILLPGQYPESRKKRTLYQNIKDAKTLTHLIQSCKDRDLSYQEAATYLRIYRAEIDAEEQEPRKANKVEKEVEKEYLSYEETREVYLAMSKEQGLKRAFHILNKGPNP